MGPGPLTIVARDSAGHRADVIIAADKFPHSADHIPDHSDPSELAALRQKVTQLEAEIEVLNAEAARKEWTRIAAALAILLGIAGFGWDCPGDGVHRVPEGEPRLRLALVLLATLVAVTLPDPAAPDSDSPWRLLALSHGGTLTGWYFSLGHAWPHPSNHCFTPAIHRKR